MGDYVGYNNNLLASIRISIDCIDLCFADLFA